jgi:hypothetical protein
MATSENTGRVTVHIITGSVHDEQAGDFAWLTAAGDVDSAYQPWRGDLLQEMRRETGVERLIVDREGEDFTVSIDCDGLGDELVKARSVQEGVLRDCRVAAQLAYRGGHPETQIASALGVDRMTIRKWLGK